MKDIYKDIVNLLDRKKLVNLKTCVFPYRNEFRMPSRLRRFTDPRFRAQLLKFQKIRSQTKDEIIECFCRFGFTLEQIRFLILIYKLLEDIGKPTEKLKKLIKKWKIPYRKLKPVNFTRYHFLGNLYQKPVHILKILYEISDHKENFLETLNIEVLESDNLFEDALRRLNIENTIDSLPSSCLNYKRYYFMNEFFTNIEFNLLTKGIEAYPVGSKHKMAEDLVFHTNIALTDLIEKLSEEKISEYRDYFCTIYGLNNENLDNSISEFKNKLKISMEERNEGRNEDLYADPDFWSENLTANDKHICDSKWEVEIDNFLYENNISHKKPRSAEKGQYYRDYAMRPDWIVGNIMIELFGATYFDGYIEKMNYKQNNNLFPLISITVDDYNSERWKGILRRELNFTIDP